VVLSMGVAKWMFQNAFSSRCLAVAQKLLIPWAAAVAGTSFEQTWGHA
jgi:hypothetical protein